MPAFIPGLKLSEFLFHKAIQPIMATHFPRLSYSAARLEWGSDVIGFDDAMSMDHGWGPKLTLFLSESDHAEKAETLQQTFSYNLPFEIHGFPTHFGEPLQDGGKMSLRKEYPIHHMVSITTPENFFQESLGVDIHQTLTPSIWLSIPQQKLRTLYSGQIYYDGLGTLSQIRERFTWYPDDVWLYLMACQWKRIDQEAPFMGRTGIVGDELGSRLIAARLIKDCMRLGFLIERIFAPYIKWFGTAFSQLRISQELIPVFDTVLTSQTWKERESALSKAYVILGEAHNRLQITPIIKPDVSYFHNRPFLVPPAEVFIEALRASIKDPEVLSLPPHIGSVDQFSDSTDILENNIHCHNLRRLYQ